MIAQVRIRVIATVNLYVPAKPSFPNSKVGAVDEIRYGAAG